MPSTHLSLHYHLVFSTKDRIAHMHKDWRGRLHAYLGGIINDLGGVPETIGGVEDHVHLLVGLRATIVWQMSCERSNPLRRNGFTKR